MPIPAPLTLTVLTVPSGFDFVSVCTSAAPVVALAGHLGDALDALELLLLLLDDLPLDLLRAGAGPGEDR